MPPDIGCPGIAVAGNMVVEVFEDQIVVIPPCPTKKVFYGVYLGSQLYRHGGAR